MFAALGKFIYRRRLVVAIAGLVFMITAGVFGTSVISSLKGGGFDDPNSESSKAALALHEKLGRDEGTLLVLFTGKNGQQVESAEYKKAVEATLAKIEGKPGVGAITTYYKTGATQLVSLDKQQTYAVVGIIGDQDQERKYLETLRPLLKSDSLQVRLGGIAAVNDEVSEQVSKDLATAESLSFPILAVLLVFMFGSLISAALPLAIGGLSILGAFLILRVITNFTDVSIFALNVITILGLGLAIDYSLFVVSRFREELVRHNGNVQAALTKTMQTAGRTVLFSGLTVAISLLSLLVFPQMFLQSMGMGGAAAVMVAMISALTVLPAILALLGRRVNSLNVRFWSRSKTPDLQTPTKGFWYTLSRFVMRRPALVLVATLIPLIWVGLPFLRASFSTPDARSLPTSAESRAVSEVLTNQFPKNETQPVRIIVRSEQAALTPASLDALFDYTRQLAKVPGVSRVDSLVNLNPQLDKVAYRQMYSEQGRAQNPQVAQAVAAYSKDNYSVVNVLYTAEAKSSATQDMVREIRKLQTPTGLNVEIGGDTAQLVDFLASLERSIPIALGLVVAVIFVLLFLMLGSLIVPLKAVVLNILSLSVSFGALVWIFQDGNLADLLGFTPIGTIDGTQPVLIFAIAFGLSMDYEVFLLSRIKENYDRTKDTAVSVALGVQKTGGIITSAALLLIIVIGSFALGEVVFIKQIGVGLGLAVIVDATIVRMFLVPATMRLMGKFNWWAPAPLTALYHRIGMSEVEQDDEEVIPARDLETPALPVGAGASKS